MSSESSDQPQELAPASKQQNKGEKKQQNQKQQQKKGHQNKDDNDKKTSSKNAVDNKQNKASNPPTARQGGASGRAPRPPRLALFDHLSKPRAVPKTTSIESSTSIHPAIVKLGELFVSEIIHDDDDRAQALLVAFCNVIEDYKTPPHTSLSWDLDKHIKLQVQHLVSNSRAHSMAMGNIIKYVRFAISQIPPDESEADAKSHLVEKLNTFLEERIIFARDSICAHSTDIIKNGDVIVTFGSSPLVRSLLVRARKTKSFRVIVIDSMPRWDGLHTVQSLVRGERENCEESGEAAGLDSLCVYASMAGAAAAMKEASRVFLGASALLSNGTVVGPAGTGMIACLASHNRVPVIVASESYKFSDKVQMDSIVYNELVDPLTLMGPPPPSTTPDSVSDTTVTSNASQYHPHSRWSAGMEGARSVSNAAPTEAPPYELLHLRYDLTPMRNVSAVVTEVGMIPPTSVPVLIRELARYDGEGAQHASN